MYQEQYRAAQAKLQQMPKGKQFDFPEPLIFGRFEVRTYLCMYNRCALTFVCGPSLIFDIHNTTSQLFAARVLKLIELFTTLDQFIALSQNKLEGMEVVIAQFHAIVKVGLK